MNYVKSFNFFGVNAKEIPCNTGTGAPTTSTEGAVGCLYMNTTNGDVYKCTAVNGGVYTWEILDDGVTIDQTYSPTSENPQSGKAVAEAIKQVEPMADDIPRIFYGASIPQDKTETVMKFRYSSKTLDFDGYCETKAQGNSSMSFPKKNQTTKLFEDLSCEEKHKIAFKNWGKQNKFCLKANWIDLTHARNVVSARLWGDVVRSRADFNSLPELMRTSPNFGAVDGFPVRVFSDGVYQGRYTLNIPKDKWMANMDDENPNHCILCGENYGSGCFREAALIDGSDWSDEIHDTVPENIKTRWNQVISFVMNTTDEEFVANLDSYIDVESAIDYHIFGLVANHVDGFGKNQLFLTYDGMKWYASTYDMDSTFGMSVMGAGLYQPTYPRESYGDYLNSTGNLLYVRLAELFEERILERWNELRNGALSASNIINRFEEFCDVTPPHLVAEDYAETTADGAFVDIPQQDTNNIQFIRDFVVGRLQYVNSYLGGEKNLWSMEGRTGISAVDTQESYYSPGTPVPMIGFDEYRIGVTKSGYWSGYWTPLQTVQINGNDVTLGVQEGDNDTAGYGIAVRVNLISGKTYKITYDVNGPGEFSLSYYDSNDTFISYERINAASEEGSFERTVTIPDCASVLVSLACLSVGGTAEFTNISIVEV